MYAEKLKRLWGGRFPGWEEDGEAQAYHHSVNTLKI